MDGPQDDAGHSDQGSPSAAARPSNYVEKCSSVSQKENLIREDFTSTNQRNGMSTHRSSQILWSTGMLSDPIPNGFYSVSPVDDEPISSHDHATDKMDNQRATSLPSSPHAFEKLNSDERCMPSYGGSSSSVATWTKVLKFDLFSNNSLLPFEEWNIDFSELIVQTRGGIGFFGEVFHGIWNGTEVAIKVFLEQDLNAENMKDFFNEISILRIMTDMPMKNPVPARTPEWMAPELIRDDPSLKSVIFSAWSDVGVVHFESTMGRSPPRKEIVTRLVDCQSWFC